MASRKYESSFFLYTLHLTLFSVHWLQRTIHQSSGSGWALGPRRSHLWRGCRVKGCCILFSSTHTPQQCAKSSRSNTWTWSMPEAAPFCWLNTLFTSTLVQTELLYNSGDVVLTQSILPWGLLISPFFLKFFLFYIFNNYWIINWVIGV